MELCYVLIYGQLPDAKELAKFEETVVSEMMVQSEMIDFFKGFKESAHPMAMMTGVVGALSAFEKNIDVNNPMNRELVCIKLIAKMPTLAALSFRTARSLPIVYPKKKYNYVENFLYMMFSNPMDESFDISKDIVKAIDLILILHADHE